MIPSLLLHLLLPIVFHTAVATATVTVTTASIDNLRKSEQWISLQQGLEFQSSTLSSATLTEGSITNDINRNEHENNRRNLNAGDTQGGFQTLFQADGLNTKYNTYATAWRYLGFYVDCSTSSNGNNNNKRDRERDLGGGGNDKNNNYGCARYLLWAAVRSRRVNVCVVLYINLYVYVNVYVYALSMDSYIYIRFATVNSTSTFYISWIPYFLLY